MIYKICDRSYRGERAPAFFDKVQVLGTNRQMIRAAGGFHWG